MKSQYLLPVATALVGFSIAWLAKPTGTPPAAVTKVEEAAVPRPARTSSNPRPASNDSKRPKEVKAGDFPLADQAELGPKTRDEAKMLRLTEALGLSIDQQGDIIRLVEGVQATASDTQPVIEDLTTRGKAVEDGLGKLLTPEQLAKFEELRARERENRIEVRAQKMLTVAIDEIDLSPDQREEVLNRLRQKSKAELQSIPNSATLLFDKSMLPTGGKELSADGILLLAKMGENIEFSDPATAHQKVIDRQRGELEELLKCFDGILTAGQMGQYQAGLAETRAILKSQQEARRIEPKPKPETARVPPVEEPPEVIPDTPGEPEDVTEEEANKASAAEDE
jgi:hypothetical protein